MSLFAIHACRLVLASTAAIAGVAPDGTPFAGDKGIGFLLNSVQFERYVLDRAVFIAKAEILGAEVKFGSDSRSAPASGVIAARDQKKPDWPWQLFSFDGCD